MKTINNFIFEKLKLSKDITEPYMKLSEYEKETITDKLCQYFQGRGYIYNKLYNTKLEILDKFFHSNICEYFDKADLWEDMADFLSTSKIQHLDLEVLRNYIETYHDEIYKEIDEFVLR